MKLHLERVASGLLITGYGEDWILIGEKRYTHSLLIGWMGVQGWDVQALQDIHNDTWLPIRDQKPEIVLLGTGHTHQFLHPAHYASLSCQQIALDCMTTAAACRTYNILAAEGRKVLAALMIPCA